MRVRFYAHACFRLEGAAMPATGAGPSGRVLSIITDPYNPESSRFDPVGETCDVVLMSSATDRFHSDAAQVPGTPRVINTLEIGPAGQDVGGVHVVGFPNQENKPNQPADNAMYALSLDGVKLLHMGDAGRAPSPAQVAPLAGEVDVLLAPSGGPPTIPIDDLIVFIRAVRPRLVIPMHYYHPRGVLDILPVTAFTERYPAGLVTWQESADLEVMPDDLPDRMHIVVLPQSR